MDRAPLGPNIDRSHVIKDNLDRYWLKTFETAKGKKVAPLGVEPRASG